MDLPGYDIPKLRSFINVYTGEVVLTTLEQFAPGYTHSYGQMVSRDDYPELFRIIGEHYGTATEKEFRLPDFNGKVMVRPVHD